MTGAELYVTWCAVLGLYPSLETNCTFPALTFSVKLRAVPTSVCNSDCARNLT